MKRLMNRVEPLMTTHKVKDGTDQCAGCGASLNTGHWWADRRIAPFSTIMVSDDCDVARSQIYGGEVPTRTPSSTLPNLKPAELERLALLMEECGEVVQSISKIMRHGYSSAGYTNRADLEKEIGDVLAAVCLMAAGGDIDMEHVVAFKHKKLADVRQYLHHQEDT